MEITAILDLQQRNDGTTSGIPVTNQSLFGEKQPDMTCKRKCLKGSNVFLNDQNTLGQMSHYVSELYNHQEHVEMRHREERPIRIGDDSREHSGSRY